jgi:hypothetical protein
MASMYKILYLCLQNNKLCTDRKNNKMSRSLVFIVLMALHFLPAFDTFHDHM